MARARGAVAERALRRALEHRVAEQGYSYRLGSTAFHPLYPLLIGGLGRMLGGNYLLAGWLVAQICCVAMLALLYTLVLLDYDQGVAQQTTLLLIGSPLGFIFLVPYAESLLLLCIVGAFYAARRGRWLLAGLAGASAASMVVWRAAAASSRRHKKAV
jgi:hypothetical protein